MSTLPLLQVEAIDKSFPGVHALDHVNFALRPGEVHVLLGENGAGKSTLMKIISGALSKDSGRILMKGKEIEIKDPLQAHQLGIGMVYQELSLIPKLTVAENIFLGRMPQHSFAGPISWPQAFAQAKELMDELGVEIDPTTRVENLGVGERQLVEIVKALALHEEILMLDEPTSALSDEERQRLFTIIRRLQERGVGVIYVSHRLEELHQIGQTVTVLRDGKNTGTLPLTEVTEDKLISMMVGRELTEEYPKIRVEPGPEVLRVEGLSVKGVLRDINFSLRKGEILGIFGLVGAGRSDLAKALFGLHSLESGTLYVNGEKKTIRSPSDAIQAGLGFLTEDRKQGLALLLDIPANITLASLNRVSRLGILNQSLEEKQAQRYVDQLQIHTPRLKQRVNLLSGGNQQKVALAKWLCSESKILVVDEPTRGIDVGAKAEVFRLLGELAKQGTGILMISSELTEVMAVADRILTMARGTITAEYEPGSVTQEEIMRSATGGKVK